MGMTNGKPVAAVGVPQNQQAPSPLGANTPPPGWLSAQDYGQSQSPLQMLPQQPAAPQWQQQYQQMQAQKAQYSQPDTGPSQLLQMLGMNQPQQSPGIQAYMNMMGGGHFGGIVPQGNQGRPLFRPPQQQEEQKNPTTFGNSPWPGVWGGV